LDAESEIFYVLALVSEVIFTESGY
jgi:hypothetical protein